MKKLSETLTELGIDFTGTIVITDANGNETYSKNGDDWQKWEYDAKGNETYYEDSEDSWDKWEYDANGKVTYHENSTGHKQGTPRSAKTCEGKVVEVDGIKYELKALNTL